MTFFPMIPVALFAQVGFGEPTANHNVHALFRSRSRQNPQPATRLGKFQWEPVYLGVHAFFRWLSRHNPRLATDSLGKTFRNPFIMAISPRKIGPHAKTGERLGKIRMETVYHGERRETAIGLAKPFRLAKPFGLAKPRELALLDIQNSEPPSFSPDFPGNGCNRRINATGVARTKGAEA